MTERPNADRYVVEGRGEFPTDMLRRDQSAPATEEDRLQIETSIRVRRRVTLTTRSPSTLDERWESFGWRVVRPLRPWFAHAGYVGPEPTEDVPAPDPRRALAMRVICPDDSTARRIEDLMRAAIVDHPGVVVEASRIERIDHDHPH